MLSCEPKYRESFANMGRTQASSSAQDPRIPHSVPPPADQCNHNKETIHSGHFMVSEFEAEAQDDEENVAIPVPDESEVKLAVKAPPARIPRPEPAAMNFTELQAVSLERRHSQTVAIDSSLTKLFQCMSLAYRQKLTSPKWNRFKGLKLRWKDKIRLNNIIWRAWHMQFIKRRSVAVCQFASPLDVDIHVKPEAIVLEGKYWKRKLAAVTAEYKKWRIYYRNNILRKVGRCDESDLSAIQIDGSEWSGGFRCLPGVGLSGGIEHLFDDVDLLVDFNDTLFSTLLPNQPYYFPNPREIARGAGIADFIQPGLVQLQPNLDEFMDTLEPLHDLLQSKLPPVAEEVNLDGVSSSQNAVLPQPENQVMYAEMGPLVATDAPLPATVNISPQADVKCPSEVEGCLPSAMEETEAAPVVYSYMGKEYSCIQETPYSLTMASPPYQPQHTALQPVKIESAAAPVDANMGISAPGFGFRPRRTVFSSSQPLGTQAGSKAQAFEAHQRAANMDTSGDGVATVYTIAQEPLQYQVVEAPVAKGKQMGRSFSGGSHIQSAWNSPPKRRDSAPASPQEVAVGLAKPPTIFSTKSLPQKFAQPTNKPFPVRSASLGKMTNVVEPFPGSQPVNSSNTGSGGQKVTFATNVSTFVESPRPPSIGAHSSSSGFVSPTTPPVLSPTSMKFSSDSSGPDGTYNKEHRRVNHINAEHKRRCNIKNGFDTLQQLIPSLQQASNAKVSKAAMLHKAADLIAQLKQERHESQDEVLRLRSEIESISREISVCQSQLPDTGAPVVRHKTSKVMHMYRDHVRQKTLQDWKFWIFSHLTDPLAESFNNSVSTASLDDLFRTTSSWAEQHCALVALRPSVLASLRQLSTNTSILSNPLKLAEEAADAVSKQEVHEASNSS